MAKQPFTQEQIDFIKKNRLKMTINKMCVETGLGYTRIHGFMVKNNLTLTKEERKLRNKATPRASKKGKEWVPDPWKYGLNLITMAR